MSLRRSLAAVLTVSLTAFLCASCADTGGDTWQPPRIVRIEGVKGAYSVSPMYGTLFGSPVHPTEGGDQPLKADEGATYVLVRDGELVASVDGMPFPYAAGDGTTLSVEADEGKVVLGGKTVAIKLDAAEGKGWTWLRDAPDESLAALRLVQVDGPAPEGGDAEAAAAEARQALARLAKANPHLGVLLDDASAVRPVLETLDPPWLSVGDAKLTEEDKALLAAEPALHTLMMSGKGQNGLGFLSRLGGLRTLTITNWKGPEEDKPPVALPTIPSLRTLIVFGAEMKDLGPVGSQPNLRELVMVLSETLTDLGGLAKMPGLRALSLQGCKQVTDLSALSALKRLRWLALPPKTTQEQFQQVCSMHPDLLVLQAVGCEKVTDLAPAAGLKRLRVLCAGPAAPLEPLAGAGSLKLLGVHTPKDQPEVDRKKTEQAIVRVMEANPDLVVVEVGPLCLGSGWILALAPLGLAAWLLARRRGAEQRRVSK